MTGALPTVSVGLAVYNEREVLPRCIESVLAQDFTDFELVISDNVSDDGTRELLSKYAAADSRVRLNLNTVNIGQNPNMNRVFEVSRGRLFRWISADDWLEPGYLSTCVDALAEHPDAIGVSTYFTIHTDDGHPRWEEYAGPFPTSPRADERFARMLWFFYAGDAKYDPMYAMYRREAIMRSHRLIASEQADWLLSAELALMGPIHHVPARLANRTRSYPTYVDLEQYRQRLHPVFADRIASSSRRLHKDLLQLVEEADLTPAQRRTCRRELWKFRARDSAYRLRRKLGSAWRRRGVRSSDTQPSA